MKTAKTQHILPYTGKADGATGVLVEYSKGILTVRHIEGNRILIQRKSSGDEWTKRIWPTLQEEP